MGRNALAALPAWKRGDARSWWRDPAHAGRGQIASRWSRSTLLATTQSRANAAEPVRRAPARRGIAHHRRVLVAEDGVREEGCADRSRLFVLRPLDPPLERRRPPVRVIVLDDLCGFCQRRARRLRPQARPRRRHQGARPRTARRGGAASVRAGSARATMRARTSRCCRHGWTRFPLWLCATCCFPHAVAGVTHARVNASPTVLSHLARRSHERRSGVRLSPPPTLASDSYKAVDRSPVMGGCRAFFREAVGLATA